MSLSVSRTGSINDPKGSPSRPVAAAAAEVLKDGSEISGCQQLLSRGRFY